jgi:hypothetical protein
MGDLAMKKIIVLTILLAALVLSAINPWPSQLRVWNWTGDNVYFRLSYRGEQKYFLTATHQGNTDTYKYSLFEVARKKYTAEVTACTVTATGTMDLNTNLKLTFTDCDMMRQFYGGLHMGATGFHFYRPGAFWGEPGMEKPNFYQHWDTYKETLEFINFCPGGPPDHCFAGYMKKLKWELWQFQYDLPADYEKDVVYTIIKDECPTWCFDEFPPYPVQLP